MHPLHFLLCRFSKGKDTVMFFTIDQKAFSHALSLASPFVGQSTIQMPILKTLRFDAEPGQLVIQAANDQTRVRVHAPAEVQAAGSLLVPAQAFAHLVSDLPAAPVSVMSPSPTDATTLQLRGPHIKANVKLAAFPLEEFPQVTTLAEGEDLLTLDAELLREIIEQVAVAAAPDDSRPILQAVSVVFAQGQATFLAANAFRLAYRSIPIPDQRLAASLLIPASILRQLARVLPSSGIVRLGRTRDGRSLLVQTREMDLSTGLMEGIFPNVGSLLALPAPTWVTLPTQDLRNALRLMASFTHEKQHQFRWMVESDALLLEVEAPDLGTSEVRLTEGVTISGPALLVRLNQSYLADALDAVATPQVLLEMNSDRHPVTIKPMGPLDARHIVMPQFLQTSPAPTQVAPSSQTTPEATASR
jgi:DNA polymerase III subunit beta